MASLSLFHEEFKPSLWTCTRFPTTQNLNGISVVALKRASRQLCSMLAWYARSRVEAYYNASRGRMDDGTCIASSLVVRPSEPSAGEQTGDAPECLCSAVIRLTPSHCV